MIADSSVMLSAFQLLSMVDDRIQQKTKNTPHKHAIVAPINNTGASHSIIAD
jgi:hypothetical protein